MTGLDLLLDQIEAGAVPIVVWTPEPETAEDDER